MAPGPYVWDASAPQAPETRRLGDNRIREMKATYQQVMQEGPMANFPTDGYCTLGWPRCFLFATLAALVAAQPAAAPWGRLAFVTTDGANTGMWLEDSVSAAWKLIQG